MDRMTSMATFVKVVESGGFSAAARTLSMSPSMVTAHVQSLEERLGVRLLNRSTRRVSLTVTASNEPAVRLYRHCGFEDVRRFLSYVWDFARIN